MLVEAQICRAGRSNKTRSAIHALVPHAGIPKARKSSLPDWQGIKSNRIMLRQSNRWHFVGSLLSSLSAVCLRAYAAAVRTLREARLPQEGNGKTSEQDSKQELEARTRQEMDMGLLSFAKSVGTKIFGATETAAAPPEQLKEAAKHGLGVSNVEVKTVGDKVILSGSALDGRGREDRARHRQFGWCRHRAKRSRGRRQSPRIEVLYCEAGRFTMEDRGGRIWPRPWRYHRIFAANKPLLSDPDKIYPGHPLRTESQRIDRCEDVFDSCALAGWACPAKVKSPPLSAALRVMIATILWGMSVGRLLSQG